MKLLNVLLREILLFLEFRDIHRSQLHLVNKQFFHIIVEDNELVRRILPLHLQLIFDYEQEREHQIEIIQADEDSQDSDSER
ncbi:unnamed protein product [Moneuplotes crassus]|uniref:F-box domain-containing protein n=1 Tax=Euplotes crassus TaxID=5936 RepID=A0AAD2DAS8_EUPCR|nr:unnamed protein product [Moneuplotes crassus]